MDNERNPTAFPTAKGVHETIGGEWTGNPGMTLRDYFAGQALVSMGDRRWEGGDNMTATQKSAKAAYSIADAMLEARQKGGDA